MSEGQLIPGTLPSNCYPKSPQVFYNTMFQLGGVQFPNLTGIIISDSQPAAEDRDKGWVKTIGGGPIWPPLFVWFNAQWVAMHLNQAGDGTVRTYKGSLAGLTTYDGGDALALGPASGPMWQVDPDSAAKFILATGTLPSGKVLNVGDTGGEETHVLTVDELAAHTHVTKIPRDGAAPDTIDGTQISTHDDTSTLPWTSDPTGGDAAHNNMPVYIVYAQIIRTARVYYRGA